MSEAGVERKLPITLAADVVGYSRHPTVIDILRCQNIGDKHPF